MPEVIFLSFLIFLQFFLEFSCLGWAQTEFGTKIFFSLFLGLSHPVLAKNNAGKRFFNFFLNFFATLSEFFPQAEFERKSGQKFFFSLFRPIYSRFG